MNWLDRVRAGLREHEDDRGEVAVGETSASPAPAGAAGPALEPAAAQREERTPEAIGPHRVMGVLGRGGVGVVYVARSERLDRLVAVKVLRVDRARQPELVERFDIEARAAARLRHPNIVGIHEVGEHEGKQYLVMELVAGRSLAARLRDEGPLPGREAARLTERLARALAYAHERWVLHRDIKPANVLVNDQGEPLLTDFGMAKVQEKGEAASPTVSGQVMGTPSYMPPEQARGEHARVDRKSDVYALGATLYEMLTGRPPWDGPSVVAILARVVSEEPVLAPSALRPELDRDLETICLQCLEKDPGERYAGADELADDLARWLADEPIRARRPTARQRARKWLRRNRVLARTLAASSAGAVLLLAALTVGFVARLRAERADADAAAAEASRQAERARARAGVAQEALRVLIYEVRDQLDQVPGERVRRVRAELLEQALGQLERLRDAELAEGARLAAAEAQRQIGELRLARPDQGLGPAAQAFERALALATEAARERPGDPLPTLERSAALVRLAEVRREQGDPGRARTLAEEALAGVEGLDLPPPHRSRLEALRAATLRHLSALAHAAADLPRARLYAERGVACARLARGELGQDLQRALALALDQLATVLLDLGDLPAARTAFEEAVALSREGRAGAAPDVLLPTFQARLARVLTRQGELTRAAASLQEAVAAARSVVAADPALPMPRAALGELLGELSAALRAAGRLDAALAANQEAVAVLEALARAEPDHGVHGRALAGALRRLAQLLVDRGDPGAALPAAERAVALLRDLAAPSPGDASLRYDLSLAVEALGRGRVLAGDVAGGLAACEEVVALRRALLAQDPSSRRHARALLVALHHLGDVAREQEQRAPARSALTEALALARRLAAEDPTDLDNAAGLIESLEYLSKLEHLDGDLAAALPLTEEALELARAAHGRDPARLAARHHLAVIALHLAGLRAETDDLAGADAALDQALPLLRGGDEPPPLIRRELAMATVLRGELRERAGRPEEALACYAEAAAALRALAAAAPGAWDRELSVAVQRTGALLRTQGRLEPALRAWEEVLALRRALLRRDPGSVTARRDLSAALVGLAATRQDAGDLDGAVAAWTEALEQHRALAAAAPAFEAELRDLQALHARAVARRDEAQVAAGARAPGTPLEHLALAEALYHRGEHARSAEAFAAALADEALRGDLSQAALYNGACAAALAGQRERALAWLREDGARHRELLAHAEAALGRADLPPQVRREAERARDHVRVHFAHARQDPDLASLRGPELDALYPP